MKSTTRHRHRECPYVHARETYSLRLSLAYAGKLVTIGIMGKRGTPRTPTAILKLRGSDLVAGRSNEPDALAGNLELLESVSASDEATRIFKRLATSLKAMRVLGSQDATALSILAATLAKGENAARQVSESGGDVIDSPHGKIVNPWSKIRDAALESSFKMLKEFGLTPATRSNVEAMKGKADKVSEMFNFSRIAYCGEV